MCRLFEVSLKSVVEVDYLDALHLGASPFHGYSSTALFLFDPFHATQIFNHITASFHNIVYT